MSDRKNILALVIKLNKVDNTGMLHLVETSEASIFLRKDFLHHLLIVEEAHLYGGVRVYRGYRLRDKNKEYQYFSRDELYLFDN